MKTIGPPYSGKLNVRWDEKGMGYLAMEELVRHCSGKPAETGRFFLKLIYHSFTLGLAGFPEAIQSAFPKTEIQLCIVHQIRNSLKYVASKNQKEFMADLKKVYQASSKDSAEHYLLKLDEKW